MNKVNEILLRRKNKIFLDTENSNGVPSTKDYQKIMAMLKNLEEYGYTLSKDLINRIIRIEDFDYATFYKDIVKQVKKLKGADVTYNPMYPNFPKQVADATDIELIFNAFIHYISFGTLYPKYNKDERFPLFEQTNITVIEQATDKDIDELLNNLLSSKTSLSQQDKDDMLELINHKDGYEYLPNEIPLKENIAIVGKHILVDEVLTTAQKIAILKNYCKTATDVLRIIVAYSDGDISLAEPCYFRNMPRAYRLILMELLDCCGYILEDMFRHKGAWLIVAEKIHPLEPRYKQYTSVQHSFNTIKNYAKPRFFNAQVQQAMDNKNVSLAIELLKSRPSEYARKLDALIRIAYTLDNKNDLINQIIYGFSSIVKDVSTTVLSQVQAHFMGRSNDDEFRTFFPKGNTSKTVVIKNELTPIDTKICQSIAIICSRALFTKFRDKERMGKVYISSEFDNIVMPFSQRSASESTKIITRGSRLKTNKNIQRGYIWWTNDERNTRIDIDLSVCICDKDWNCIDSVSYTNLKSKKMNIYHSGDIINGGDYDGDGAAEFIDVDMQSVIDKGGRYAVFEVFAFTDKCFNEMEHCRFGIMEREDALSGEIFEPKTNMLTMNLNSHSRAAIPMILDCESGEFIWADLALINGSTLDSIRYTANNLENNLKGTVAACYGITHMNKPTVGNLAFINAQARGECVLDRDNADIIFDIDITPPKGKENAKIITPFDVDYFMNELL